MKNLMSNLKTQHSGFEKERTRIIELSQEITRESKRLIHNLLHNKVKNSAPILKKIKQSVDVLLNLIEQNPYLYKVGAASDGLEEYVELVFLDMYIKNDKSALQFLPSPLDREALIGGIADATGELVRLARNRLNIKEVEKAHDYILELYEHFLDMEVSRNNKLRSKVEDIHRNLLRAEDIIFNLKLKEK